FEEKSEKVVVKKGRAKRSSPIYDSLGREGWGRKSILSCSVENPTAPSWFPNSVWEPRSRKLCFLHSRDGRETEFRKTRFPNGVWEPVGSEGFLQSDPVPFSFQ